MGITSVDRNQNKIRYEPSVQLNWDRIGPIVAKIMIVALVMLALAAATYFSFGAALPMIVGGAASWHAGLSLISGIGCGIATLAAPVIAASRNMFRVTKHNLQDTRKFLACMIAVTLIAGFAFVFRHCQSN